MEYLYSDSQPGLRPAQSLAPPEGLAYYCLFPRHARTISLSNEGGVRMLDALVAAGRVDRIWRGN